MSHGDLPSVQQLECRWFTLDQILEFLPKLRRAHTCRRCDLGESVRVLKIIPPKAQHITPGNRIACRVDINLSSLRPSGLTVQKISERYRYEMTALDGDESAIPAVQQVLGRAISQIARVLHIERDRIGAAKFVPHVFRHYGDLDPHLPEPFLNRHLQDLPQVDLGDPDMAMGVPFDVFQFLEILRFDSEHHPLGNHSNAILPAAAEALRNGADKRIDDISKPAGLVSELFRDERKSRSRRFSDSESEVAHFPPHGNDEVPAGSRLCIHHQVLDDFYTQMPGGLIAKGIDFGRKVEIIVDRLRDVNHLDPPRCFLLQFHRRKSGVITTDRDQPGHVEPEERDDRIFQMFRIERRIGPGNTDVGSSAKMDPAYALDRQGNDVVDVPLHDPAEAIADAEDFDAFESGADRGCTDHAVDAGGRPASDQDGEFFRLGHLYSSRRLSCPYCKRLAPISHLHSSWPRDRTIDRLTPRSLWDAGLAGTMGRSPMASKTNQVKMKKIGESPVADAFRRWGYLQADLDALGRIPASPHPEIDCHSGEEAEHYRALYCGTIGIEFMHTPFADRSNWLAERMERKPQALDQDKMLERLASVELLEEFLHARYIGTKRFALDGSAALIPLIDSLLDEAAELGVETALIGMSHRGRLNVMVHNVGTPTASLIAGFEDVDPTSVFGSGDVKHHLGATGVHHTSYGKEVRVHLVSNPSHLEAVNPVVMGRVRARQERMGDGGRHKIFAINIHGDAAFAGQGITAETLNLATLPGYRVGGVIHIVVNNLIGFTAEPHELHSSRFSTDVAKRLPIPIIHVNGEDPESVVRAGRIALEFRDAFESDVVIDIIGFRRFGHSELDDPTTTQPLLYKKIKSHPNLWESYARKIGASEKRVEMIRKKNIARYSRELDEGRGMEKRPVIRTLPPWWDHYHGGHYDPSMDVETAVSDKRLREVATRLTHLPRGFSCHPKVAKLLGQRSDMVEGKRKVDWGMAEALAFGTLLWDGVPVRITGQDSVRGTFNQRHASIYSTRSGDAYTPLRNLHSTQGRFDIFNSVLSEAAVLGFEYGFSRDFPDALVIWEAQFGDFANGAQIIIDQFVTAGEDKWDLLSGLVMLLPHGYEGQGPEHSSARYERFLQLAGEDNIQVCQPSTAGQYFHLLRRQVLRKWRKPLVVMTPKSLLRADPACSSFEVLRDGKFQTVIPDREITNAERVLVCSGKIAHELRAERKKRKAFDTAIVTIEQFVPFPKQALREAIRGHQAIKEVVWVQEEPANMGGLFFVRPLLEQISRGLRVSAVKRTESASPATGSSKAHGLEQKMLISLAFTRIGG